MKKSKTIPTLIGLSLVLLLTAAGGYFINKTRTRPTVGAKAKPTGVKVGNITDRSFTVSWFTKQPATGALKLPENSQIFLDDRDQNSEQKHTAHLITVDNLKPQKKYSFVIISAGEKYQQNSFQTTTAAQPTGQRPAADFAFGQVLSPTEQPASEALIFLSLQGATQLTTVTNENGHWSVPLSAAFNKNKTGFVSYNRENTPLELTVETAQGDSAQVITHAGTDHPIPPITLGQSYDYSDEPAVPQQYPDAPPSQAEIFPSPQTTASSPSPTSPTDSPVSANIDTPQEGEVIFSPRPKFSGQGPSGKEIIIKVESETPYENEVAVSEFGHWEWQPPEELSPGEHTLTVRWQDDQGTWQTITRSFSVKAADSVSPSPTPITPLPTQSQTTLTPTPTTTATLTPTSVPTMTTSSPTDQPTTTITQEATEIVSGNLTPLLILTTLGISLFVFALAIGR